MIDSSSHITREDDEEDEVYHLLPNQQSLDAANAKSSSACTGRKAGGKGFGSLGVKCDVERTLGAWFFDKKQRKRKYIALTGKIYVGTEGMRHARMDQQSEANPVRTARYELKYLMGIATKENVLRLKLKQAVLSVISAENDSRASSSRSISPPSSMAPIQKLSSWGFPEAVVRRYQSNKVLKLFPWQVDCLTVNEGSVLSGFKNLIYSAPTSGGKTLVAEVLMLRRLAHFLPSHNSNGSNFMSVGSVNSLTVLSEHEKGKENRSIQPSEVGMSTTSSAYVGTGSRSEGLGAPATCPTNINSSSTATLQLQNQKNNVHQQRHTILFVVPFVALAEEKAAYFQDIWQDMNIGVKAFHGDGGDIAGNTLGPDVELAVCTIERANILLTQLLDEGREDQLKMVVIDEIHMLSDPHRGYLLEVMLSKVMYLLNDQVQVVGMSATLPNIEDLARWLDAALYNTTYRPVELDVRVCLKRTLYSAHKIDQPPPAAPLPQQQQMQPHTELITTTTTTNTADVTSGTRESNTGQWATNALKITNIAEGKSETHNGTPIPNPKSSATSAHAVAMSSNPLDMSQVSLVSTTSMVQLSSQSMSLPPPVIQMRSASAGASMNASMSAATTIPVVPSQKFLLQQLPMTAGVDANATATVGAAAVATGTCNKAQVAPPARSAITASSSSSSSSSSVAAAAAASVSTAGSTATAAATSVEFKPLRQVESMSQDPDGLKRLSVETAIIHAKSVMMFCNSKQRCQNCAKAVATAVKEYLTQAHAHFQMHRTQQPPHKHFHRIAEQLETQSRLQHPRQILLDKLRQTPVGLCPDLRQTVPYGCAYHHAGLTMDERQLIEEGFRQGTINVLCTTSTLSAGVNLPAHRVIVRSPRMGDAYLSVAGFRQMCGRAGRLGYDARGEAILMIEDRDKEIARQLMTADIAPLNSSLSVAAGGGMEKLLLEMICCGRLAMESQVIPFLSSTLMHLQAGHEEVVVRAQEAVKFLKIAQFVQHFEYIETPRAVPIPVPVPVPVSVPVSAVAAVDPVQPMSGTSTDTGTGNAGKIASMYSSSSTGSFQGQLRPTALGVATTVSGIPPKDVTLILQPLLEARRKIILKGGLHPVYLVTPPSTPIEPDWPNYERILHQLYQEHPDAQAVAKHLGIDHGQLITYARNKPLRNYNMNSATSSSSSSSSSAAAMGAAATPALINGYSPQVQLYRRFFSAILLFTLIQEWPITSVTRLITTVTRGQLQQLQKDAAVFCGMTVVFCQKLNWDALAACLSDFSARLNYGVHKDILPLVRLGPEITASRARVFLKQGVESAQDLVFAGLEQLTQWLLDTLPYDARDPLLASEKQQQQQHHVKAAATSISTTQTTISAKDRDCSTIPLHHHNNNSNNNSDYYKNNNSREHAHRVCERLAKSILKRASDHLVEEARRANAAADSMSSVSSLTTVV